MLRFECALAFVVATTVTVILAQSRPSLKIEPSGSVVQKKVGETFVITCKPNVPDPRQITDIEWRDPNGHKIDTLENGLPKSIYVQRLGTEHGLVLIFSSLTDNQAGNYTCSANYVNTEHLKASVQVQPFVDVTFVDAPESQFPRVGEDYLVRCKVVGKPVPLIEWNKNEKPIVTGDRYVTAQEGLLIRNVRESDDGVYRCTAFVFATGVIRSRDIKVETIIPPVITPMEEVSVIEGETASTKCVAKGKPPPTYTWIKKSRSQDLSKTDRFDVKKTTGDLIITRVEFHDNDIYKCVAENRAGRAEKEVKINVLVKPKIYELLNVTSPVGSETKIICKVQGRPVPTVEFRKVGSKEPFVVGPQKNDPRIILEQEPFSEKGEAFGTLVIRNLNRSDDGLYECIAENKAGMAYKNGHITVEFKPTFERTKRLPPVWTWGDRPGNITCIPEAIPNATITWRLNGVEIAPDSPNFKQIGKGPVSHLIVHARNEPRFYTKYECVASNKLGTASHLLELKQAFPPGHITQIKAETITATTVKYSIVPPSYFDGLPIRSFLVQYKTGFSWDEARNHTWSFNSPYILENLIPEVSYDFRFAAVNDVGIGPWTNGPTIRMPRRSEPAEPKIIIPSHLISNKSDVIVASPYADHFELRWSVPNDNGDPIDSYLIRYCSTQKVNGEWRDTDCSEEIRQSVMYNTYEFNTLKPDTTYKIELRAHNAIGASSPAQIRVKTARGRDQTVVNGEPSISSAAIIGIVVAAVFLVLLVVDCTCFVVNRAGILAFICNRNKAKKHDEEDTKLGSYKAAPAHPNSLNLPLPVKLAPTPTDEREPLRPDINTTTTPNPANGNGEKAMSVEFDGKHVFSKPPGEFIGKHSAV